MGFLQSPSEAKIAPDGPQVVAVVEPLSASSDEEDDLVIPLPQEPQSPRRRPGQVLRRRLTLQALQDNSCRTCKMGRRWSRRVDNNVFLQNLTKQSEDGFDDILQQEPTVFEKLLSDKKDLEIWEAFISKPEEEQHAFLSRRLELHRAKATAAKLESEQDTTDRCKPSVARKCFKKICPLVQEFLNSGTFPKGTLLNLEPCIIQFFLAEPEGQYVTDPLGNNDRKVLHGLAQYLDLNSQSFNSEVSYDHRCTKVTNPKATFTAPEVLLSEFLGVR